MKKLNFFRQEMWPKKVEESGRQQDNKHTNTHTTTLSHTEDWA